MKINYKTQNSTTNDAVKAATGKSWDEWFADLDSRGGPSIGRREIGNYLIWECKLETWWSAVMNFEYEAARGVTDKDGRHKGYTICSTKTINAPLATVYEAWTSAEALDKWFGSANRAEVADGGTFSNADGNGGTFKRVRANKDLRFTWSGPSEGTDSIVDVTFQDKGSGKVLLMVTHDRIQSTAEADGLRAAWGEALTRLKVLTEASGDSL
jgi:uncharacterized protein YndB with AHSA1/START domain